MDDLPHRLFERALHDVNADLDVTVTVPFANFSIASIARKKRHSAAGDDAVFDGRLRGMHRVFDAGLLFLHLGLGGRADLDDRDAADELREALLELLAVVVGGRLVDLGADLLDPARDRVLLLLVGSVRDDRRVFLVDRDLLGVAEVFPLDALELDAEVFGDQLAAREDRDVFEHGLAAIAEARGP